MTSVLNPSFWNQTAIPYKETSSLNNQIAADVTVIGAGITGLRSAIELAEKGLNVAVLDRYSPGWGASGRNGGQVNPIAHTGPEKILEHLGDTFGPRMLESYMDSGNEVFNLIRKYDMECDAVQKGWIRAAHCPSAALELEKVSNGWAKFGLDIKFVGGSELHNVVGSNAYDVATIIPSGGSIQPLSYIRELARVAKEIGVKVFERSAVNNVKAVGRDWLVESNNGSVKSEWVLFCTNGYTDNILKGLKKTIIPIVSVQAVTRPLSEKEYSSVLPEGHTLSDTRRVIYYSRKDRLNRLLFGSLGLSQYCTMADRKRLHKGLKTVFPQFSPQDLELYWGGKLAFTEDLLPHLHEPAPGILAGLGYNGRGVAMATVMGRILSERVLGKPAEDLAIPTTNFKPFPLHGLHKIGVYSAIKSYELRDAFEARFG